MNSCVLPSGLGSAGDEFSKLSFLIVRIRHFDLKESQNRGFHRHPECLPLNTKFCEITQSRRVALGDFMISECNVNGVVNNTGFRAGDEKCRS